MDLKELHKEVEAMIAKYGSNTIVVRFDSRSFLEDIKHLQHANIDEKEFVIIN